jgi:gamma-glutamyltranspeptidase/glutathione hydrolase
VPGSPATWQSALDQWGTYNLKQALTPAEQLAQRGFVVDSTFHQQTEDNKQRFQAYTTTPKLYLPNGDAPPVGSVLKNPDLANTYQLLGQHGMSWFYNGPIAKEIAGAVQHPAKSPSTNLPVMPGYMTTSDLAGYKAIDRAPTHTTYRGHDVYGMGPASSGGTTVGEALNIMKQFDLPSMSTSEQLHHYLEASALAYADRNAYIGDPAYVHVPESDLLSDKYAAERACNISETQSMPKPVAAGDVNNYDGKCDGTAPQAGKNVKDTENVETTNMTVTDKWGNVVEYTLTIEQTGGSGQLLAHRGFILNNELTDFSAVYDPKDPNRIEGGKRPRSSISPTIILDNGKPYLALGSPGGATIITTVLQMIFNRIDRGMTLPQAIAEPRASQENGASTIAEQSFIDQYGALLKPYGDSFTPPGAPGTSAAEIGAATAIEFGKDGLLTAVSEPTRRGGGSALVVSPSGG